MVNGSSFVSENVVFEKVKDITTSRSKWLVAFVIDINPYQELLSRLNTSLTKVKDKVTKKFNRESKRNPKPYYRLLHTLSVVNQEIKNLEISREFLARELDDIRSMHRTKRSLIPIVGKALSFLFGTLNEDDINIIKSNVQTIARNQQTMNHVLKQSLTIIETTQTQSMENANAINNIIETLGELRDFAAGLSADFLQLRDHLQIYTELDIALSDVKMLIDLARDQLQHLKLTLNVLSMGHLSPSVISPINFQKLLLDIKNNLEPEVMFPFDPKVDIWNFYKTLTCTTMVEQDKLVVVIAIPLLDTTGDYELFKVHNFDIPRNVGNETQLLASFHLESKAVAIDRKRTQFVLLTEEELRTCVNHIQGFCAFRSPVYSIMGTTVCLMHIFLESTSGINKYCTTMVKQYAASPTAQYLINGHWVVVSGETLTFKVICKGTDRSVIIKTKRPLDIISLDTGCSAFSGQITLLPYFHQESKYNLTSSLQKFNFHNLKLWRTLDLAFPNTSHIKIPKKLAIHDKIPVNDLINELNEVKGIADMPAGTPIWLVGWLFFY